MKLFTAHPKTVGETYREHFRMASSFGVPMVASGIACILHGVFPFMFERTGSDTVRRLHDRMVTNRQTKVEAGQPCYELDWCI